MAICWIWISIVMLSCSKKNTTPPFVPPPPPVVVTDSTPPQYGTPFSNVPDRQDADIYQVNIRAFSQAGNLQGVISRLDSIKALGVNVIYLMPIYPVGVVKSVNSPYCVKNYTTVGAEFGSLSDLQALVDGAHSRNMSVMLDWVANHTSWDNPWITQHKDWYQQDGSGNIISPPGYNDVAQLNYNNASMRLTMIWDMKYWVYAANVDGFRCDFADNIPVDFWQQAIDTLHNIAAHKLLLLAEGSRSANFTAGFDYNFGFAFYGNLKNIYSNNTPATTIDNLNTSEYAAAVNGQQVVRYTNNHDVNSSDGTPLQLFGGKKGSLAAFVVAACMKSVPMIYDGQEVGMAAQIPFPFTTVKVNWADTMGITPYYKNIIAFRNNSEAVRRGLLTSYTNSDVCAFTKIVTGDTVFVIDNLRNANVIFTLPPGLTNTTWVNEADSSSATLGTSVNLGPYTYMLLEKK